MKMKFFERTYLLMLILFLLVLNGSILSLAVYTHHSTLAAEEQICLSEEFTVREAFERDFGDDKFGSDRLLRMTYCAFYEDKGIALSFAAADGSVYSTLPEGISPPTPGKMVGVNQNGRRYILITEEICDGAFVMTYAKDVSHLDEDFRRMAIYFALASLVSSALLALLMYLTLRRLYTPLAKLRAVTQAIAEGDTHARADETGDDEFATLGREFNRMTDRIAAQMEELVATAAQKQRMLDDLAHEMRTPLTGIHGYAEYVCNANISEEERIEATQYIMAESMRLRAISETLLNSAFIREKKITRTQLSAATLLADTKKRHELRAVGRGVVLLCEPGDATLEGDRVLLELLLSNLTENAIKACSDGDQVTLRVWSRGGAPVLTVEDTGVGMTEEELAHITEPFYRIDKSRSRAEGGTGLGLALCVTIAEAHGAHLQFASVPGKGPQVSLCF